MEVTGIRKAVKKSILPVMEAASVRKVRNAMKIGTIDYESENENKCFC